MKKRLDIYGTLEYPLCIGCAAFIKEEANSRRTSAVKHFLKLPSGATYIETQNTHYVLHPPAKVPAAKGVRV